ncbi:MAG: universal stress protein [Haloferacaceae archaeon]
MYRILVAVDRNEERAKACAKAVADLPGDPGEKDVTIVYSFTDNPQGGSVTRLESVRIARDYLEDRDVPVTIDETSGDPQKVLPRVAEDIDADLIVLAGRKRSPAGKALFGSVTQSLILNSDRPVLVTGASTAD